jgi:hypothetical protein
MPTYRYVTGKLLNPNSVPLVGSVYFTLVNRSYTNQTEFPSNTIPTDLDELGNFRVRLWCNEEGERNTFYVARFPDKSTLNFTLPVGTSDIDISLLETAGTNPSDPQYQTMLTFLEAYIQTEIGTSSSGIIKIPFAFGDASPKLITPGFTGIVRTAGIVLQTSFNVGASLQIGTQSQPGGLFNATIQDVGTYEAYPGLSFSATDLYLTLGLGFNTTQGSGIIYLEV